MWAEREAAVLPGCRGRRDESPRQISYYIHSDAFMPCIRATSPRRTSRHRSTRRAPALHLQRYGPCPVASSERLARQRRRAMHCPKPRALSRRILIALPSPRIPRMSALRPCAAPSESSPPSQLSQCRVNVYVPRCRWTVGSCSLPRLPSTKSENSCSAS